MASDTPSPNTYWHSITPRSFERDLIAGTIGRSEAVDQIAAHYLKTVTAFVS